MARKVLYMSQSTSTGCFLLLAWGASWLLRTTSIGRHIYILVGMVEEHGGGGHLIKEVHGGARKRTKTAIAASKAD